LCPWHFVSKYINICLFAFQPNLLECVSLAEPISLQVGTLPGTLNTQDVTQTLKKWNIRRLGKIPFWSFPFISFCF
jgi:hypothetical protein